MIDPQRVMGDLVEQHADLLKQLVRLAEKNDTLRAELEPWRQMTRQLEALRGEGWQLTVNGPLSKPPVKVSAKKFTGDWYKYIGFSGEGDNLPEAVNAAYEQLGVGDE